MKAEVRTILLDAALDGLMAKARELAEKDRPRNYESVARNEFSCQISLEERPTGGWRCALRYRVGSHVGDVLYDGDDATPHEFIEGVVQAAANDIADGVLRPMLRAHAGEVFRRHAKR